MKVSELFTKPINRPINGVIKAEQMDMESVWQELEEFVVTKELDVHLRKFLDTYLNAIDNPNDPSVAGKVGVWVSGFFGSGKSHFIKILSHLLKNKEVTKDGVTQHAIDFFKDKIQDPMLAADIKRAAGSDIDVILFNIDTKADIADGRDVILRVFLKVFNEHLGFSGDHPHIAHMERYLVKQGKYEAFQEAFKEETGEDWFLERDAYNFHSSGLAAALSKEPALGQLLDQPSTGDLLQRQMRENAVKAIRPLVVEANMLGRQYVWADLPFNCTTTSAGRFSPLGPLGTFVHPINEIVPRYPFSIFSWGFALAPNEPCLGHEAITTEPVIVVTNLKLYTVGFDVHVEGKIFDTDFHDSSSYAFR